MEIVGVAQGGAGVRGQYRSLPCHYVQYVEGNIKACSIHWVYVAAEWLAVGGSTGVAGARTALGLHWTRLKLRSVKLRA